MFSIATYSFRGVPSQPNSVIFNEYQANKLSASLKSSFYKTYSFRGVQEGKQQAILDTYQANTPEKTHDFH